MLSRFCHAELPLSLLKPFRPIKMLSINQVLLDEISLEGLEGITYESLWIRLDQRIRFLKETIAYVDKQTTPACVLFPLEELENHEFLDCLFRITLKFAKKGELATINCFSN